MTKQRETLWVTHRPLTPILLWDGDCNFCARWIARWKRLTGRHIVYCPYQKALALFPEIAVSDLEQAVHLIQVDGRVLRGAEAVLHCFQRVPLLSVLPWLYRHCPPFAWLTEKTYAIVARNRSRLP